MGKETVHPSIRLAVGNGKSIDIKEDRWLSKGMIRGLANIGEPQKVEELFTQGE